VGREQGVDKESFKQIFRDHWEGFKLSYPGYNDPYYDGIIEKITLGVPGVWRCSLWLQ